MSQSDNPIKNLPILIVDDNRQYAQLLKRILESGFGFSNITSVDDTQNAKELINEQPEHFKMLFIDYNFPDGCTGGDLLQDLNNKSLLEGKAAFLITSEPSNENVEQASKSGALGVVVKPFNREDLEQKIQKAFMHLNDKNESF